jgi:hypothetical protein
MKNDYCELLIKESKKEPLKFGFEYVKPKLNDFITKSSTIGSNKGLHIVGVGGMK